jgi:hypothetical protein
MNDPWQDFPYPNNLTCDCGTILIHGWARCYNCPKCGTHYDYDPFYIAALCEINLDKYPNLREKYKSPFTDEYAIKEIEKHKNRILNLKE